MSDDLTGATFIAWVDFGGYEGWRPTAFASEADVVEWILSGESHGSRFVITRGPVTLALTPPSDARREEG